MSEPQPGRSWVAPGQAPEGPVPAGLTRHAPATAAKPQRSLYAALGLLAAAAGAFALLKFGRQAELQREFDAQSKEAPLRLPAVAAEPPKELAGILPDTLERDARLSPPPTPSELNAGTLVQAPEASDTDLSPDIAQVAGRFKDDPIIKDFAGLLAREPGMRSAALKFQKDGDLGSLMRTLQGNPRFMEDLAKLASSPGFRQLAQKARALPRPAPAEQQAPTLDPTAMSAPEAGGGDTVDPRSVSGDAPALAPAAAPPAPGKRP